jgi:hypothetical protein
MHVGFQMSAGCAAFWTIKVRAPLVRDLVGGAFLA